MNPISRVETRIREIQSLLEEPPAPNGAFEDELRRVSAGSGPSLRTPPEALQPIIHDAAERSGVSEELLAAVIQQESGFHANAVSPAGAMGLMQLMPGTARTLGVADPFDPRQNVMGGAEYLRRQLQTFGSVEKALAAYNAGPAAVQRYNGIPPYAETQAYVRRILGSLESRKEPQD